MSAHWTVVLLFVMVMTARAGDMTVNGYIEPQFSGAEINGSFVQLNTNKLRIDLGSELSENITFTGNINFVNYSGKTEGRLSELLPRHLVRTVPDYVSSYLVYRYEDKSELDNAYLRFFLGRLTVTAGRQQISVGSGYVWNPTDLFNSKGILDPTYEQSGVNGLRADVALPKDLRLSLFFSPESRWKESGKLVRLMGRLSHFDIALSAGRNQRSILLTANGERHGMFGVDINGELFGLGCWTETAYNDMGISRNYWTTVVGFDYTLESGLYWMVEYYRDESGLVRSRDYSFWDWMRYLTGETKTLSQDQIYSYCIYPATDLLSVGGSVAASLSDGSLVMVPTVEYSLSDDVMLTFFGSAYFGETGSMYSKYLGSGGLVRVRAYF